jgi:hypothetical protein
MNKKRTAFLAVAVSVMGLAACSDEAPVDGGGGTGGTAPTAGVSGAGQAGSLGAGTSAGGSAGQGVGGAGAVAGSAGAIATGGAGGSAGAAAGSAGSAGTLGGAGAGAVAGAAGAAGIGAGGAGSGGVGGTAGSDMGGTAGTAAGAAGTAAGSAGAGAGGTAGAAGSAGTGGTGGSVSVSPSCEKPAWPTATGSPVNISGTRAVSGTYDGQGALHEGNLEDCTGDDGQDSTEPMFEVADGGTIRNVIMGNRVGDGIHCLGSCTIENVWFANVCDDAITMHGGSGKTMTVRNSGFKRARDKTIQHNGTGSTVNVEDVYIETAGKLYRSCGDGCSGGARSANFTNIYAVGIDQLAGISTNDTATFSNICTYRTGAICTTYDPGSEDKATNGQNGTNEGPSENCDFGPADVHALVNLTSGSYASEVLCPGPNSAKSGSTATACIEDFETCLKPCTPGGYGFKQLSCSGGEYAESACGMPADAAVAGELAGTNSAGVTDFVEKNSACTTEWEWARDESSTTTFCVCVSKPGYYQESSGWFVWDCQTQWW